MDVCNSSWLVLFFSDSLFYHSRISKYILNSIPKAIGIAFKKIKSTYQIRPLILLTNLLENNLSETVRSNAYPYLFHQ